MDRDGNGYLGASDLSTVFFSMGENLDDDLIDEGVSRMTTLSFSEEKRTVIKQADNDGDGQISIYEFRY